MNDRPGIRWGAVILTLVVAGLLAAGGVLLFGYRSVDAGQVALRFGGGAFDGRNGQFKAVHGPGRSNMGLGDRVFPYPDTVRNFVLAPGKDADAPPVPCATRPTDPKATGAGPRVDLAGQFLFFLNTSADPNSDRSPLGDFHRKYGTRFHAWQGFDDPNAPVTDGWAAMLNQTFRPVAESVLVAACRNFTVDDLSRQDRIDALEATVGQRVTLLLHQRMGGPYFCGTGFDRNQPGSCTADAAVNLDGRTFHGLANPIVFQLKPVLPPKALTDAAERLATAEKNLAAAKKEAEAVKALATEGLTGMPWVAYQCLKDEECRKRMTFVAGGAAVATGGR